MSPRPRLSRGALCRRPLVDPFVDLMGRPHSEEGESPRGRMSSDEGWTGCRRPRCSVSGTRPPKLERRPAKFRRAEAAPAGLDVDLIPRADAAVCDQSAVYLLRDRVGGARGLRLQSGVLPHEGCLEARGRGLRGNARRRTRPAPASIRAVQRDSVQAHSSNACMCSVSCHQAQSSMLRLCDQDPTIQLSRDGPRRSRPGGSSCERCSGTARRPKSGAEQMLRPREHVAPPCGVDLSAFSGAI